MVAAQYGKIGTAFDWITQLELAATCSGVGKGGGRVRSTFNGSNSEVCGKLVACPTSNGVCSGVSKLSVGVWPLESCASGATAQGNSGCSNNGQGPRVTAEDVRLIGESLLSRGVAHVSVWDAFGSVPGVSIEPMWWEMFGRFLRGGSVAPAKTDDVDRDDAFVVSFTERPPLPAVSMANPPGKGHAPCQAMNPSFIPASAGLNRSGVLLRMCCGENVFCNDCGSGTCNGRHPHGAPAPSYPFPFDPKIPERISFAPCDLATGVCGDVEADVNLDPTWFAEDPRAFLYNGWYYNFYWRGKPGHVSTSKACTGKLCGVMLAKTKTPLVSASWEIITDLPWVRNGCCFMKPKGQKSFCLFGSGPDGCPNPLFDPVPKAGCNGFLSGLGVAYTTDIDVGVFTQVPWSVAAGVNSPLTNDSMVRQRWPPFIFTAFLSLRSSCLSLRCNCSHRERTVECTASVDAPARNGPPRGPFGGRRAAAALEQRRPGPLLRGHDVGLRAGRQLDRRLHRRLDHPGRGRPGPGSRPLERDGALDGAGVRLRDAVRRGAWMQVPGPEPGHHLPVQRHADRQEGGRVPAVLGRGRWKRRHRHRGGDRPGCAALTAGRSITLCGVGGSFIKQTRLY